MSQPQDIEIGVGQTATFSVTSSETNPGYQWFGPDGNPLSDRDGEIEGTTSATLQIFNVQPTDIGTYRVRVFVDGGSVNSDTVILTIGELIVTIFSLE